MRRTLRRTTAATAATALLLALSACSNEEEPSASDEATTESSSTSEPTESDSSSPAEEPTDGAAAEGEVVDNAQFLDDMVSGLEQSTTAQLTMTSDFGGTGFDAEGEVDYTTTPVSMELRIGAGAISEEETELRLVDGVMYMNLGAMSNGRFVRFDLNDPKSLPPGMSGLTEQMDPLSAFKQLEPALKSVTLVGTDEVEGEQLDRYALVVDTKKLESMQELPSQAGIPDEVAYDLWFDDEFRIRRMEMVMETAQPITLEAEFSEWGTPVDIAAPPKSQVVEPPQPQA